MKPRWIQDTLIPAPLYYTVCTTEKQFKKLMREMGYSKNMIEQCDWLEGGAACCNKFERAAENGEDIVIVCMPPYPDKDPNEKIGLLIHESVHVWQHVLQVLHEDRPSREFEAYGIQCISQTVIAEYSRQTSKK